MKAIVVTDEAAGTAGMTLVERPEPRTGDKRCRCSGSCVGIHLGRADVAFDLDRSPRP